MSSLSDEEEFFEALKKEYLTTEQKLQLIKEYNGERRREEWEQTLNELEQRGIIDGNQRTRLLGLFK